MTTPMRTFGQPTGKPVERIPVRFYCSRDEEPEALEFNLLKKDIDVAGAGRILRLMGGDSSDTENAARAVPEIVKFVSKYMDNKDGIPASWEPTPLPVLDDVVRQETDPESGLNFRAPDGSIWPMSEAYKFEAFDAGSSRRRWLKLMQEDDDVEVDQTALIDLFKYIAELAGGRPTPASS